MAKLDIKVVSLTIYLLIIFFRHGIEIIIGPAVYCFRGYFPIGKCFKLFRIFNSLRVSSRDITVLSTLISHYLLFYTQLLRFCKKICWIDDENLYFKEKSQSSMYKMNAAMLFVTTSDTPLLNFFVIIRCIDAFHKQLSVIYIFGQCAF